MHPRGRAAFRPSRGATSRRRDGKLRPRRRGTAGAQAGEDGGGSDRGGEHPADAAAVEVHTSKRQPWTSAASPARGSRCMTCRTNPATVW
jgi:hypothetical protein